MKNFIRNFHTYIFANLLAISGTLVSCMALYSSIYDKLHPKLYEDLLSGTEIFGFALIYCVATIICLAGFVIENLIRKWLKSPKSENFRNSKFYKLCPNIDLHNRTQKIHIVTFWFLLLIGSAKANLYLLFFLTITICYYLGWLFETIKHFTSFFFN